MLICPKCKCEYQEGYTVCNDCKCELVKVPEAAEGDILVNKDPKIIGLTGKLLIFGAVLL